MSNHRGLVNDVIIQEVKLEYNSDVSYSCSDCFTNASPYLPNITNNTLSKLRTSSATFHPLLPDIILFITVMCFVMPQDPRCKVTKD